MTDDEDRRAFSRYLARAFMGDHGPKDTVTIEHPPCAEFARLVTRSRLSEDGETIHVEASVTLHPAPSEIVIDVAFSDQK